MRVRRSLDFLFLLCNTFVICFLMFDFVRADANASESTPVIAPAVASPQYAEQQLAELATRINTVRVANGLKPLQQSTALDAVADVRVIDMSNNAYYAHKGSNGQFFDAILRQKSIDYSYACENLNMSENANAENFVNSWLGSEAHKSCLLDDRITDAGYAITKVHVSSGIAIDQYVVAAIYTSNPR